MAELPIPLAMLKADVNSYCGTHADILAVSCESIGEGKGFLSTVVKADITWNSKESVLPKCVIIKIPACQLAEGLADCFSGNDSLRELHNQEVDAYTYFNLYTPPIKMVRCFRAEKMEGSKYGCFVMDFARGRSLTWNDDYDEARMVVAIDIIANVHAYSIINGEFDKYFGPVSSTYMDCYKEIESKFAQAESDYDFFKFSDDEVTKLIESSRNLYCTLRNNLEELPYPPVVCLGDLQPNNILWDGDGRDCSHQVSAVIDFQLAHKGSFLIDLCDLYFWCLGYKDWNLQSTFIGRYHQRVTELTDGRAPLSLEKTLVAFRHFQACYYVLWLGFSEMLRGGEMKSEKRLKDFFRKMAVAFRSYLDSM